MANAESIDTNFAERNGERHHEAVEHHPPERRAVDAYPFTQMFHVFQQMCRDQRHRRGKYRFLSSVAATNATYSGKKMTAIPRISMVWLKIVSHATVLNHW